jgi:hypothetical protein
MTITSTPTNPPNTAARLSGSGKGRIGKSAISNKVSVTIQAVLMAATLRLIVRRDARFEARAIRCNWCADFEAFIPQIPATTCEPVASASSRLIKTIWQKAAAAIR